MYKKIMVPLDGSELAECVLPHAAELAKGCQGAQIQLLHIYEPFRIPPGIEPIPLKPKEIEEISARTKTAAEDYMRLVTERFHPEGVAVKGDVLPGPVVETITDCIAKNNIDLVIIATHGRSGVSRWVWGSVADRLLRASCAPVFMVRAPGCIPGM